MKRLAAALGAVIAVGTGLALTAETAQAAEMSAAYALPPFPVAPSVLGGIGTATGGELTIAAAGIAAAGEVAAATAVYFGTAYATYAFLDWKFGAPEPSTEQPPAGDHPLLTGSPQFKALGSCGAVSPAVAVATGFAFVTACPSGTSGSSTLTVSAPAWRCKNGATTCSGLLAGYVKSDGTLGGLGMAFGGFGTTASGAAGNHTWSGTYAAPAHGVLLYWDPAVIEWTPPPLHRWKTIVTCKNKVSGATSTETWLSAQWIESAPLKIQPSQCPVGWLPTKLDIWETDAAGTTNQILRYSWTAPPDVAVTQPTSPYKNCYPGGSEAPCLLTLYKVMPDGTLVVCTGSVDCTTYTKTTTDASQYRCLWGTSTVPLTDCSPLEPTVKTAVQPTTTQQPGSTTTVVPIPTTGVQPPVPEPTQDEDTQSCIGAAWSWNPVDWVVVPVRCALKWAFVPKAATMTSYSTRLRSALDASTPGLWVGAIGDVKADLTASESGCTGPWVPYEPMPGGGFYPLNACSGVMAQVAGVTKTVLTFVIAFFGGLACLRALGSGLGWSPGLGRDD